MELEQRLASAEIDPVLARAGHAEKRQSRSLIAAYRKQVWVQNGGSCGVNGGVELQDAAASLSEGIISLPV